MDSITCMLHLFLKMHKVVLLDDFFLFVIFNNVTQQTNKVSRQFIEVLGMVVGIRRGSKF